MNLALTALLPFCVALLVSSLVTPRLAALCHRTGLLDEGDSGRAMHESPTPRLGGLAVAAAFFAALTAAGLTGQQAADLLLSDGRRVLALVVGGIAALTLGAIDDVRPLRPTTKLLGQTAIALVAASLGLRIVLVSLPVLGSFQLDLLAVPLTVVWLVLVMNAINLIDGLDGLATGVSLTVVIALLAVSIGNEMGAGVLLGAALAGALLGFLRHNAPPASIFLGDSGSLFLGYALGAWSLFAWQKSATGIAVLSIVATFGLPLLDVAFALSRRLLAGRNLLGPDADHFHHRLARGGLGPRRSALVLVLLAAIGTAAAVALA